MFRRQIDRQEKIVSDMQENGLFFALQLLSSNGIYSEHSITAIKETEKGVWGMPVSVKYIQAGIPLTHDSRRVVLGRHPENQNKLEEKTEEFLVVGRDFQEPKPGEGISSSYQISRELLKKPFSEYN